MSEASNVGTFEQTCLRKPHERVVGRIVGANNNGKIEEYLSTQYPAPSNQCQVKSLFYLPFASVIAAPITVAKSALSGIINFVL